MTIKFIKKHYVGIPEGFVVTRNDNFCKRMIDEGYAVEFDAKTKSTVKKKRVTKKAVAKKED